jgi:phosphatidate cytidylyltransferase
MLKTRLWMGAVLILVLIGVVLIDPAPWYPLLMLLSLAAAALATRELIALLNVSLARYQLALHPWLCHLGVTLLIVANVPAHGGLELPAALRNPWHWVIGVAVAVFLFCCLVEAAVFQQPGGVTSRLALTWLVIGYLGLLSAFFLQLRWLKGDYAPLGLALAVFVPKSGDIGAYFTGRFLGRHRLAPILSPKKTWEGAIGGLGASTAVAIGINALSGALLPQRLLSMPIAVLLGISVGTLAQLGDLVESLIKRDSQQKDASTVVPGFGGVLDVLDSILFSVPLTYGWIAVAAPDAAWN